MHMRESEHGPCVVHGMFWALFLAVGCMTSDAVIINRFVSFFLSPILVKNTDLAEIRFRVLVAS